METQQSNDVRATERVFKKVVYPGLETLRVVDRNGVPISYPGLNSVRTKSFILSPRGVPMRAPNHVYSGCHSHQAKVTDLVDRPPSPENYYSPEKTFLTQPALSSYSAKLPRNRNESPLHQKKRAATSQSIAPKHLSKSAFSDHFLTSEAQEKRILQSANGNSWNKSNQGLRLQREWTTLSNTRSIKRASEIVDHRVDRMYFMNGNSIKLKPRYDVDDEELSRMKELQAKNKEVAHKRVHIKGGINCHVAMVPQAENVEEEQKAEPENCDSGVSNHEDEDKENTTETSQCRVCDHESDVRHTVSQETGIPEMEIKEEHINFGVDDPAVNTEHQVQVIDGPIDIIDILSHKDQQKLGECMLGLMKSVANLEHATKFQNKKPKFKSGLKKSRKYLSKTARKCGLDTLQDQYPNLKNFPRRKKPNKCLHEPVNCNCRKSAENNLVNMMVTGRQLPIYGNILNEMEFWNIPGSLG